MKRFWLVVRVYLCFVLLFLAAKPLFMLYNRVIERNLRQGLIPLIQVFVIRIIQKFTRPVKHVAELAGKHAAVPKASVIDIFLSRCRIRLLLEAGYSGSFVLINRHNIAVLFRGISRVNPHQGQICLPLLCQRPELLNGFKIILIHIWIHRADNHCFLFLHALFIVQIRGCKRNRREGIASTGLHTDVNLLSQLIMQCRNL